MSSSEPSLWLIFSKDISARYGAIIAGLGAFILIAAVLYPDFRRETFDWTDLGLLTLATVVFIYLVIGRIRKVRRLFSQGVPVQGELKYVAGFGLRIFIVPMLDCSYSFQGKEYSTRVGRSAGFETGQEVTVLLDPENPDKPIIKDVFSPGGSD